MFKDKILAAIKAKFPKVNLSKARLTQIAAIIEKKVIDDETKIDAALDEFNEFNPIAELAKQDDTLRDLQAKLSKTAPAKKEEKDDVTPVVEKIEVTEDTPAYVKKILEKLDSVTGELAVIKGEKVANTIKAKATDQLKEIPLSYWSKRALPEKDEDLEAFIEEVKTDYATFKAEMTDGGLTVHTQPKNANAGGGDGDKDKASAEEVVAVVDLIT